MTMFGMRLIPVIAAAGLLAACQTTPQYAPSEGPRPTAEPRAPQPAYPTRPSEATPPGQADPDAAPPPVATPRVESRPLDSLPPAQPRADAPPPSRRPPPQPVMREFVTGRVVDAEGPPRTHTVAKGDTLYSIARKMEMTPKELAAINDLDDPSKIRPGQRLKGKGTRAKAYTVASGDTLYAIAQRFSVAAPAIAEANDIEMSSTLRVGQKLVLPAGYKDKGPIRRAVTPPPEPEPAPPPQRPVYTPPPQREPPPPPVETRPPPRETRPLPRTAPPVATPPAAGPQPSSPQPYNPLPQRPATQPPASRPAPTTPSRPPATAPARPIVPAGSFPTDSEIGQLARGRFVWPLRGDLISEFGPKSTGQRNDGINIRAGAGAVVRAAAAGEIVYAGDQVPGFGNLVLVKHADGWVTAYAHLAKISVQMRQNVAQGAEIGQAGMSGGVSEPQLHFEVRYAPTPQDRARPVNPRLALP
ncbi:MAG TPA: LysM peptidoglycan-binding domain-containing protein [Phenylobacterium sp.]|nr:LysM peptidoglycan-binding domain-containing protein [Phenylobacterium sp.]